MLLQMRKLEEALDASNQELEKSKEVLKTNENGGDLTGNGHCVSLHHKEWSALRHLLY